MSAMKIRFIAVIFVIGLCCFQLMTKEIQLGIDIDGGTYLDLVVVTDAIPEEEREKAVNGVESIIRNRLDEFILSEASVQQKDGARIVIQIPGIDSEKAMQIKTAITKQAFLEFRLVDDGLTKS